MNLPNERRHTYAAGTPVLAQNLNATQDDVVTLSALATSEQWSIFGDLFLGEASPIARPVGSAFAVLADDQTLTLEIQPGTLLWTAGGQVLRHHLDSPIQVNIPDRPAADERRDTLSFKVEALDGPAGDPPTIDPENPSATHFDPVAGTLLTVSLSVGTPAAAPTAPSAPAGQEAFAHVRVKAGADFEPGLNNYINIHDLRTPAGQGRALIPLTNGYHQWALSVSAAGQRRLVPDSGVDGAGEKLFFDLLTPHDRHRRLAKLWLIGILRDDTAVVIEPQEIDPPGGFDISGQDLSAAITTTAEQAVDLMPAAERPVWFNGLPSPLAHRSTAAGFDTTNTFAQLHITSAASAAAVERIQGVVAEWWGW